MPYENLCAGEEAVHVCSICPDDNVREFARVRRSGFIKSSYLPTIKADPTNLALWQAGIAAGAIIILPETSGSYDPGDPKELKGYGDRKSTYGPRTMKLTINDPDYAVNYHFYNEISSRVNEVPFFVTSSLLHLFDKPASIKAKDPVADDLEEEVVWQVECEVVSANLPSKHQVANILEIFTCTNLLYIATQPIGGTVLQGANKTFTVVAAGGTAPYAYQWYKDGDIISGATSASFTITGVDSGDNGSYTCVVTDSASGTANSEAAVLVVTAAFTFRYGNVASGVPDEADVLVWTTGTAATGADIIVPADGFDNNADAICGIWYPATEDDPTTWYNTVLNNGAIGPSETFIAPTALTVDGVAGWLIISGFATTFNGSVVFSN